MSINKNQSDYFEKVLIIAFENLDISLLNIISHKFTYSYNDKIEFIEEMKIVFEKIRAEGINSLLAKPSKCKYCYPTGKAYSFHHPKTDNFIIRYVIFKESHDFYRVEQCKNNPILKSEKGIPF